MDRGTDLFAEISTICKEHKVRCAELSGLGSFEVAEVAEYDQDLQSWKPKHRLASGGVEVLSLKGNVADNDGTPVLHAHVTLMRERDNGIEVLGGHLVSARVFALELVITTFDDIVVSRKKDQMTGLMLLARTMGTALPRGSPSPLTSSKATTWDQVAVTQAEAESEEDDGLLAPGDLLIHPTFGRCEVQRIEGNHDFAHVRLKNGRLVRLALDVVRLTAGKSEGGSRVWNVRVSR